MNLTILNNYKYNIGTYIRNYLKIFPILIVKKFKTKKK